MNGFDKDLSFTEKQTNGESWSSGLEGEAYHFRFKELLKKLTIMYQTFPRYMIEIMADEYSIPRQEIPRLLRTMINQGILSYMKDKKLYFLLKSRNAS
jgi:hypothetical protein